MKKYYLLWVSLCGFILINCSPTKQIVLQTLEPSPVTISSTIKKVGIVNRSLPQNDLNGETGIDRMVAVEERYINEKGRGAALNGLYEELLKDARFESIKILDSVSPTLLDFGTAPDSISWQTIETICRKYGVDVIFSMAYFDTDTKVSLKKASMLQPNLMRVKTKVPAQEITLETLIENGWKIYDPNDRAIIDEFVFNDQIISKGMGIDPIDAFRAIEGRKDTIIGQSKATGVTYGQRLLPFNNQLLRDYYVRGSQNLERAGDLAENGAWDQAAELWRSELESPNEKVRSKSCHNLAVSFERIDDLDGALEWASKALELDASKSGLAYVESLRKRIEQKMVVQQQIDGSAMGK
ncbi:MAG: tetratricopeptide repeat protein [Maribacter sp.]|nr:tetratricopeptide repeat protein [Maribacter sp.]